MLKGKSVIELTDVHTGKKELYEDTNLVTEAAMDVLNCNLKLVLKGDPKCSAKYRRWDRREAVGTPKRASQKSQ